MPVERNSQSGVCRVIAGARMTARGIASGWRTLSFTLVAVLVTPALAENSPPAIVVGTLIWRTFGAFIGADAPDIVGETKLHGLGPVGDRAATDGDDQVGIDVARHLSRGDHGFPRRVR